MATSRMGNTPQTQYVVSNTNQNPGGGGQAFPQRVTSRVRQEPRSVGTHGWPNWMGRRPILAYGWAISMVIVGVDDWKNNGIMPRPSRLWSVSLFYGLLALASIVDALVPLINAIAIGYTLMLLWNYLNKAGQFA